MKSDVADATSATDLNNEQYRSENPPPDENAGAQ